jgi:hypothetical protein
MRPRLVLAHAELAAMERREELACVTVECVSHTRVWRQAGRRTNGEEKCGKKSRDDMTSWVATVYKLVKQSDDDEVWTWEGKGEIPTWSGG